MALALNQDTQPMSLRNAQFGVDGIANMYQTLVQASKINQEEFNISAEEVNRLLRSATTPVSAYAQNNDTVEQIIVKELFNFKRVDFDNNVKNVLCTYLKCGTMELREGAQGSAQAIPPSSLHQQLAVVREFFITLTSQTKWGTRNGPDPLKDMLMRIIQSFSSQVAAKIMTLFYEEVRQQTENITKDDKCPALTNANRQYLSALSITCDVQATFAMMVNTYAEILSSLNDVESNNMRFYAIMPNVFMDGMSLSGPYAVQTTVNNLSKKAAVIRNHMFSNKNCTIITYDVNSMKSTANNRVCGFYAAVPTSGSVRLYGHRNNNVPLTMVKIYRTMPHEKKMELFSQFLLDIGTDEAAINMNDFKDNSRIPYENFLEKMKVNFPSHVITIIEEICKGRQNSEKGQYFTLDNFMNLLMSDSHVLHVNVLCARVVQTRSVLFGMSTPFALFRAQQPVKDPESATTGQSVFAAGVGLGVSFEDNTWVEVPDAVVLPMDTALYEGPRNRLPKFEDLLYVRRAETPQNHEDSEEGTSEAESLQHTPLGKDNAQKIEPSERLVENFYTITFEKGTGYEPVPVSNGELGCESHGPVFYEDHILKKSQFKYDDNVPLQCSNMLPLTITKTTACIDQTRIPSVQGCMPTQASFGSVTSNTTNNQY